MHSENAITIKANQRFLSVGIVTGLMAALGFYLLLQSLPIPDHNFGNIFGLCFLTVWILVVLWMSVSSLAVYFQDFRISDQGIYRKTWFRTDYLPWPDVQDWGITYEATGKGNIQYCLYFASKPCAMRRNGEKKLRGRHLKIQIFQEEFWETRSEILAFCTPRTEVEPFITSIIPHRYL